MVELLTRFGAAFTEGWALPAAFAWGALSVFLSPCHLSGIPLVVAYMNGGAEFPAPRRALQLSGAFALGTLGSIAVIGFVTVAAGRMAGDVGRVGVYALASVFFLFGLHLLDVIPLPSWSMPSGSGARGARGALVLGLFFGAALGPCTFAFMAPLLGVALAAGASRAAFATLLVTLYGAGHAAAIVLAGTSVQAVQRWLSTGARAVRVVRGLAGTAVILGGLYFLYTAP